MEPQSFSFSKKVCSLLDSYAGRDEVFEGSQVKAPPLSRRRMVPPTPLQNSYSSLEEDQGQFELGGPDLECA